MADRDYAELAANVARVEERMNTKQAEYKTDIANLDASMARRDTANTRWLVGAVAVAALFVIGIVGLLIKL